MNKKEKNSGQDYNAGVKAAYHLGLLDGKNQYIRHLNIIEKTNRNLFDQLRVMDMREPDKANSVYFSRIYLEKLMTLLKKHHPHKAYEIQRIITKQLGETLSAEAKLRELLSEIEEEE